MKPDILSVVSKTLAKESKEAKSFLDQFQAKVLKNILKDGKDILDLEWYIKQQLISLKIAEKASERAEPLERIRELILLGASQDPEFQKAISLDGPKKVMKDPFKGEGSAVPDLKLVG